MTRDRTAYMRSYMRKYRETHEQKHLPRRIVGIDGEGFTTKEGEHRYVYMAACTATEIVAELRPVGKTLSFDEVARWLVDALPRTALLVGFSLGYDRTKWVESLPDDIVYALLHPEARQGKSGPRPVRYKQWRVNLVSTLFTIRDMNEEGGKQRVWDLWKFFQCSFVKALRAWKVGTEEEVSRIERMKARRGKFAGIGPKEEKYCQSECMLLAKLAGELLHAHEQENLHLGSYYGPGSTAALILKKCGAKEQRSEVPEAMQVAVASAFFGGRFECSRVGPVEGPIFAYDIASAYPSALRELPCLAHGKWQHTQLTSRKSEAVFRENPIALVRYRIGSAPTPAWGPLPHRLPDGNIVFPVVSAGGWAWSTEVCTAMQMHPGVMPIEVWSWERDCVCPPPFKREIEDLYQRRLEWGKAARGIVLKLGLNSMYGKSAQRVGRGAYRCMVRAGLITSLTRAKLLRAVMRARDPWSILELATDSVLSTEPLDIESPGLGGWERKPWEGGVMLLRPGMRFPLAGDDMKQTAARGVGVKVLHENRRRILRAWGKDPMGEVTVQQPSMFHGARGNVRRVGVPVDAMHMGWEYRRDALYGRWEDPKPRVLRYVPEPKRCRVDPSEPHAMYPWELPMTEDAVSVPYGDAPSSPLGDVLDALRDYEDDQPERDVSRLV